MPADRQEQVLCLGRDGEAAAWLLPGPAFGADLRHALFGSRHGGPIAREVAQACERDLARELASAFRLPAGATDPLEPLPARSRPWSGQVTAHIPLGGRVVATGAAVENLLSERVPASPAAPRPDAAPLAAIADALADTRIFLHVQLQECDVDLGVLQRLRPGDLLRVPHRLDAPALVRTAGGTALFQGFLARSQRRRAIELAPFQ